MEEQIVPGMALADLSPSDMATWLRLALRNSYTVDGLWFLAVEQAYGTEVATMIDEAVWKKMAPIETKRVRAAWGITAVGVKGVLETLRHCPSWASLAKYQVEWQSDTRATLRVTNCNPQAARVSKGLNTFRCQGVETHYFQGLAKAIDPGVKIACVFCPPNQRRNGAWCEWVFEQEDDPAAGVS